MPRNGAGIFSLVNNTWFPAINGVLATSSDWQTFIIDIQSALTQSVSSDGQTPFTGNLPMGNNKITGLAAGTANTDAINFTQQTGRLLRTTIYTRIAGVQNVSVDGAAPTTTGASTFTSLANTTAIVAEAIGGGGGGGGTSATGGAQIAAAGGGGGAVYGRGRYTAGFSGGIAASVGAAGTAGAIGGGGGNGGSTSLAALLVCPGGTGGQTGGPVTPQNFSAAIVGSLAAPTGANLFSTLGGLSGMAFSFSTSQIISGGGGSSQLGSGGAPRLNATTAGLPGAGYGAGGSGGSGGAGVGGQTGGAGSDGILIVYEYA